MKFWALLIMGAVSPFLFAAAMPTTVALVLLLLTSIVALKPGLRVYCLFPVAFLLVTLAINERLAQRLSLSGSGNEYTISGIVSSLPEVNDGVVRFEFSPDGAVAPLPQKIRVYWYADRGDVGGSSLPLIRAGERWRLQLELRAPRGRVNFHGVDTERAYFTRGIAALGYVQPGDNTRLAGAGMFDLQHWREMVLDKLTQKAGTVPAFRMLAALAIADRRGLLARDREILSATGTGHLLAISGLHIGLAAALGFYLGRVCLLFLSIGLNQRYAVAVPWVVAWLAALAYAALSGFGVSTQRALIMLTVATVVMLGRRNVHPAQGWLIAMVMVLALDPFAPLRAGFWFSFVAVAVLMMLFVPRQGAMPAWRKMLLAQVGISLFMAPLGMYWFQQASLPGLLANLVAIPLVSMLVVPLILLALLVLWLPGPLAGWLLAIAGYATHWLFLLLEQLAALQPLLFSSTRAPGLAATLLAMAGAAIILLPRGVPLRFAGVLLMLPMLLPGGQTMDEAQARVDFLDVGQGLSVLVSTRDYLLVYDTGPGNGLAGEVGWSTVPGTIRPMIRASGLSPDLIIASHGDLDHAGGLEQLRVEYPGAHYLANLRYRRGGTEPCTAPMNWKAENLAFSVLHPSVGLPYLGNDSSCVISVSGAGLSLLLSGDISRLVEQRLVNNELQAHTILTVPHHGSSSSSSQVFLDTVKPSWALISAGINNRFDFPRADVLGRYASADIRTLNTALCGGIRITTDRQGGLKLESARVSRDAIWRWPAGGGCLVGW